MLENRGPESHNRRSDTTRNGTLGKRKARPDASATPIACRRGHCSSRSKAQRLQAVEAYRQRDAGAGPATVAGAGDGLVLAGEETQEGLMATEGGAGIGQRRDSARRSRVQRMACSRRGSIRPNRVSDGCR